MELFTKIVCSWKPWTNFTKSSMFNRIPGTSLYLIEFFQPLIFENQNYLHKTRRFLSVLWVSFSSTFLLINPINMDLGANVIYPLGVLGIYLLAPILLSMFDHNAWISLIFQSYLQKTSIYIITYQILLSSKKTVFKMSTCTLHRFILSTSVKIE